MLWILVKHPKVPTWPEGVDWSVTEVHILAPDSEASRAYMVHAAPGINCRLFYPKVHGHVMEMLSNDVLAPETFLHWWNQQVHSRDFWIEDEDYMIRVACHTHGGLVLTQDVGPHLT